MVLARSFTLDPLFSYSPDPQLASVRDYPTWSWGVPPRERSKELVRAVNAAHQTLCKHGFCGPDDRGAHFLTTLCFMMPTGDPHFIEEWCEGQFQVKDLQISEDPTTAAGIDFAKYFVPAGHTKTLASLDAQDRARLSDFAKAMWALAVWLTQQG